jgi:ribonucleoside-diphosphate reductase alpha chain
MTEQYIINRGDTLEFYEPQKVENYLKRYTPEGVDLTEIVKNITEFVEYSEDVTSLNIQEELYSIVEGLISVNASYWQNVAGCIKADIMRKEVYANRGFEVGLKEMFEIGRKGEQYTDFFEKYSDDDFAVLEQVIDDSRDYHANHAGIHIVYNRYNTSVPVVEEHEGKEIITGVKKVETLQERYMAISMFLHQDETENRLAKVIDGYNKISGEDYMGVRGVDGTPATPTFMNAGRPNGNLSSCFIGMSGDSIDDIYREAEQFAKVSKNAGGYGLYFGKVRSIGSSIRKKPKLSSGAIPFMKLFDVTAGTVDQQGARPGAVTITLDAWHRDLSTFLKTPLDNTILEKQMHKIFLAVSVPDLFFRKLQSGEEWYQFDPKEVLDVMGYGLEDCFDETTEGGTFSKRYEECVQAYKRGHLQLVNITKPLAILAEINKTRIEKGHPFLFFRDTVNRDNANGGIIYSSNLCMEIAIPMSLPTIKTYEVVVDGEDYHS